MRNIQTSIKNLLRYSIKNANITSSTPHHIYILLSLSLTLRIDSLGFYGWYHHPSPNSITFRLAQQSPSSHKSRQATTTITTKNISRVAFSRALSLARLSYFVSHHRQIDDEGRRAGESWRSSVSLSLSLSHKRMVIVSVFSCSLSHTRSLALLLAGKYTVRTHTLAYTSTHNRCGMGVVVGVGVVVSGGDVIFIGGCSPWPQSVVK